MKVYGYIRVSAKDQNIDRQFIALKEAGVDERNIYIDKMSGKDFQRPEYVKLMKRIKKGNQIVIKSIDRLGRNYDEILEQWRIITKEKGANIMVLDMPLLNTEIKQDDLTGVFISDLVLQILAYVAETERAFIKQRQAEGIAAAKAKGVQFGCARAELPEKFDEYFEQWITGKISVRKAAKELNISPSTFYRRCKDKTTNMSKDIK